MNPIEAALDWINISLACGALMASASVINGHEYWIQHWRCETTRGVIHVNSWRLWCETNGYKYLGRPFFVEYDELHEAEYLGRFGDVMRSQGAELSNAYQPPCEGS